MTVSHRDPAAMTSAERCAEIATILAAGYVRLLLSRASSQNGLDDDRRAEAPCSSNARNPKSNESAA